MNAQDDYKVDLEVFEGPLDLLLYLIRRDEVDIYDIPIERITSQYLEYLGVMRMLDLSIAGEFIVMAATLTMIKSRMLLPVDVRAEGEEEEEGEDPRWDLVRQLVEYKKFKDAAARLSDWELNQENVFGQGGEPFDDLDGDDEERQLGDIGLFDLITAFNEVLKNAPVEPIGEIAPIQWSVPDKIDVILRLTRRDKEVAFTRLFHKGSPRGEVIVMFLALLELLRLRQISIQQSKAFGEIMISALEEEPEELLLLPAPVIGGGGEHA